MAVFLSDSFTDTDNTPIGSHSPETGGAWGQLSAKVITAGADTDTVILGNAAVPQTLPRNTFDNRNAADPGTPDYKVSIDVVGEADPSSRGQYYVLARMSPTGSSDAEVDLYFAGFSNGGAFDALSSQSWVIGKRVSGTVTLLAHEEVTDAQTDAAIDGVTLTLEVDGTSLTLYRDDVEEVSTTDSDISQDGRAGFAVGDRDEGAAFDAISAETLAAGGATVELAFTVESVSDADLSLAVTRALSATLSSESDAAAALAVTRALNASVASESDASLALAVTRSLSASLASTSDVNAALAVQRALSAAVESTSDLSVALAVQRALALSLASESRVSMEIVTEAFVRFAFNVSSASDMEAKLAVTRGLSTTIRSTSEVEASLAVTRGISMRVASVSDMQAALAVARSMGFRVRSESEIRFALTVLGALLDVDWPCPLVVTVHPTDLRVALDPTRLEAHVDPTHLLTELDCDE